MCKINACVFGLFTALHEGSRIRENFYAFSGFGFWVSAIFAFEGIGLDIGFLGFSVVIFAFEGIDRILDLVFAMFSHVRILDCGYHRLAA